MPIPTSQREFERGSRYLVDATETLVRRPLGRPRVAPPLPSGRLIVGWWIAIVGWVIARWVGRGRCGTGRRTNRDTRRCANANANTRAIHGAAVDGTAINRATAVAGSAIGRSAIRTARGSAPIGSTDCCRTGRGTHGRPAHRTSVGGTAARSRHRSPAESVRRHRQRQQRTYADDGQAFRPLCPLCVAFRATFFRDQVGLGQDAASPPRLRPARVSSDRRSSAT
jgi:hypothetical protein